MMNKEFVKYEQALALKELGFDEPCFTVYNGTNILIRLTGKPVGWCFIDEVELIKHNSSVGSLGVTAPTYSAAFRWFREKDYYSEVRVGCTQIDGGIGYEWWVWKPWLIEEWSLEVPGEEWSYKTYEEAESACLDKLIEICKNK